MLFNIYGYQRLGLDINGRNIEIDIDSRIIQAVIDVTVTFAVGGHSPGSMFVMSDIK